MITVDNFRNAIDDYVDVLLTSANMKDWQKLIYGGGIALSLNKAEDMFLKIADSEGMINIDDFVKAFKPRFEKIGVIKVSDFTFRIEDFNDFVEKMKGYDNGQ